MCKVLIMTGIQNSKNAFEFMKAAKAPMSLGNTDGIGYVAVHKNGSLFSEKWKQNDNFLKREKVITIEEYERLKPMVDELKEYNKEIPDLKVNASSFGDVDFDDIRSVCMHTRYATCGKEFNNTHPFLYEDSALIHNGVISNHAILDLNKVSTCDSEAGLQSYLLKNVNLDLDKRQEWLDMLKGYWAFGILSRDAKGRRILDIVRNGASLYFTTVKEIGEKCFVVATTKEIIQTAAKECGFVVDEKHIFLLKENSMHRFDAVTGRLMNTLEVKESEANKVKTVTTGWSGNSSTRGYYNSTTGKWVYSEEESKSDEMFPVSHWNDSSKSNEKKSGSDSFSPGDNLTEEEYTALMENCENVEDPLIDRLYMYDSYCYTAYGIDFESLDKDVQETITENEKDGKNTFEDVLDCIEYMTGKYETSNKN